MTPTIEMFAGQTFRLPAVYTGDDGAPKSLAGVTPAARIVLPGGEVALAILVTDVDDGAFTINATAVLTGPWPRGVWPMYVHYEQTIAGEPVVEITGPFLIKVMTGA